MIFTNSKFLFRRTSQTAHKDKEKWRKHFTKTNIIEMFTSMKDKSLKLNIYPRIENAIYLYQFSHNGGNNMFAI